ncbi:MAG TPA: alpha/beta fold hydrolase [Bradyrhizobium sp.]|nr:alpha/beta fold hydrolase [Bradyrhizobium sp.]
MSEWLWVPQPRPDARLRLYCFAHAGAGASTFLSWGSAAPPDIEIAAVRLPGREARLDEAPLTRLPAMAELVTEAIVSSADRDFGLFGHSAGGKLAIHVTASLEGVRLLPRHTFVSGAPANVAVEPIFNLAHDEFVEAIARRFGPLPRQITDDPEVWKIFERPLRADLEALATDDLLPRPLDTPLTVIRGLRDWVIKAEEMEGWRGWNASLNYEVVDADHFSYRIDPRPYLSVIARLLLQ